MEGINWSTYNSIDFQYFCNALLSMEIGKRFQPFSAPGKDQGIDGYYKGSYSGREGKWRFQYKFHQVARKQGFELLKTDVKKEVSKLKEDDFFILLTNVELLPQETAELNDVFQKGTSNSSKKVDFQVWDGAKLFTLFLQYPILALWMQEGFQTAQLQDYRTAFKTNLESSYEEASTLNNYFVSREIDLENLKDFLTGTEVMALVIGEAGIGKTRVVIEFFHKIVNKLEDWLTLVLVNRSVDFDKLKKALSGKKKSIILVDDAHTFAPQVIADLKRLADLMKGSLKLILTARSLEAYSSLKLIKEYEQEKIQSISLKALTRSETKELFKHELQNHQFYNYVDDLTSISHGKPILIVALLRAAKTGTPIAKVREQNFLAQYVKNYFDSFSSNIILDTGVPKIKLTKLLQLICLIEPFNYSDSGVISKLASACGVEAEVISLSLQKLQESSISSGRYEQSIRPDYYSDILLMDAKPEMLAEQLPNFIEFIENVIANLSSVDEVKKEANSLLDIILETYTNGINVSNNIQHISKIFTTISSIAFLKPAIASNVVNLYLNALHTPEHPITVDFEQQKHYYHQSSESILGRVKSILFDLLYIPSYYEFVFTSVFTLYRSTNDTKTASTILHFAKRDYTDHFKLQRQSFFIGMLKKRFSAMDAGGVIFGIQCCKLLLQLEFTASTWDSAGNNTLTITTFYLPESTSVKKFRKQVISLLVEIFNSHTETKIKSAALIELLDIPRSILASRKNPTTYLGDAEIDSILDFLISASEDLPLLLHKEVLDKIFWYRKWGISNNFDNKLNRIEQLLKPRNLAEELIHLFAKSELGFTTKAEERLKEKSRHIIRHAEPVELGLSIIEICREDPNKFHFLWSFLFTLHREFPEQAKIVYTILWQKNPTLIYQYGAAFLQTLSFKHGEKDFYWENVQLLRNQNNPDADNVLLRVYSHYIFEEYSIQEIDINLIREIAEKKNPANHYDLARALQTIIKFNETLGKGLSIEFLQRCYQREADIFFVFLGENDSSQYAVIKTLVLEHTFRFSVTYEIERCLNKIALREGTDLIIQYFLKRFALQKEIVYEKKTLLEYEWVPHGNHSHLFEGCRDNVKFDFFYAIVKWYISEPLSELELFFAKDFLEYGLPSNFLNSDLLDFFETLSKENIKNSIKLERILESLSVFHEKDQNLTTLIISIYSDAYSIYANNEEAFKEIRYKCYTALTTMGVKSGTAGQPFQVDLDLLELLKAEQGKLQEYAPAYKFLGDVIRNVEKDIQSSYERYNDLW